MEDSKVVSDQPAATDSVEGQEQEATRSKDTVKYETYRQVLAEKKKRDEQLSELSQKLEAYESTQKAREEQELREKENWKELLEKREQELNELSSKYSNVMQQQVIGAKASAFMSQVGGLKNDRYLEFVPFDQIGYDEETGKVDDVSLRKVVDEFKREHEALLAAKLAAPMPNSAPKGSVSTGDDRAERLARIASSGVF